MQTLCV